MSKYRESEEISKEKSTTEQHFRPVKTYIQQIIVRRRVPVLRQMEMTQCGAACLAMVLGYYGCKVRVMDVSERCGTGRDGLSALVLMKTARSYGLRAKALSLQQNDFRLVTLPAIVHWEFNHFLVMEHWTSNYVDVVDPALGRRRISTEEFERGFTGIVLILEPGVQFETGKQISSSVPLSLFTYLKRVFYFPVPIIQVIGASLILEGLGLVFPFITKTCIDMIIPHGINDIMPLLGVGLIFLVLMQYVTTLLRTTLLVYLQARVDTQLMLDFFEHLLIMPYHFFQQRLSGDLLSRVNSNYVIRDMLTNQLISSLLDSGTVVVYLIILLLYSVPIGLLALLLGVVQAVLLLLSNSTIHRLTQQDLVAQGKTQGYMTEALAAIDTIKAGGAEHRIFHQWSNLFFDHLNISVRRDYLSSLLGTTTNTFTVLVPLILIWFGTTLVLHGTITVGTMLALSALAGSFLTPLSSLVASGQKFQIIRAHFERISDVLEGRPEQNIQEAKQAPLLTGRVECRNLHFSYAPNTPKVLQDISFQIEPGQKVAIVGQTGSGKSTLGKLLLGLYRATEGEILYDNIPLESLNYQSVRNQYGAVLQNTALLSGSIRENIAFSDPDIDMERIIRVSKLAAIHDDICKMPMEYETLVGEGGSAVSGGQRQRLALARALVASPAVLLLDEATSHLDIMTEQLVDAHLNTLACTRIVIAHRLSTIKNADFILVIDKGQIIERGNHEELLRLNGLYTKLVQSQMRQEERVGELL